MNLLTRSRLGRRGAVLAVAGLLALAGIAGSAALSTPGNAEITPLPGLVVPVAYRAAILDAATSCPALTPARLAAQLMAESRFTPAASNERNGRGLAGLTDAAWRTWQPWAGAARLDPAANVAALAHHVCDLVGRLRVAEVSGDPWRLAVAAYRSGVDEVTSAGGVPDAAQDYVDEVAGYAAWYGLQPALDGVLPSSPATSAPAPAPTPSASPTPSPKPTTSPKPSPSRSPKPPARPTTKAPAPRTTAPAAAPTSGALTNEEFHGCLSANRAADGTHLVVAACDGSQVQRWQPQADGTMRSVGFCMDAAGAGTANFNPVQVAHCNGHPAQQFRFNGKKQIYNSYSGKCVNIHYEPGKGTSIVIHSCLNQPNQYFGFRTQ